VTPKLFKAAEVCQVAQVQPYVLRSWEKEFPGIGVQGGEEGPRLYRQSDVDQVLRIKQLVFAEGLTVAGARRRLEESAPVTAATRQAEVAEVLDALGARARTKIANVRDGLKALQVMLAKRPGEFILQAPSAATSKPKKEVSVAARAAVRRKATKSSARVAPKKVVASKRRRASA
jgi:DNA-binding transcriptional MerR regulator